MIAILIYDIAQQMYGAIYIWFIIKYEQFWNEDFAMNIEVVFL